MSWREGMIKMSIHVRHAGDVIPRASSFFTRKVVEYCAPCHSAC